MTYVDDRGKRTAPTRPSRKAKPASRNAPHNVQTPPGGDVASSGGDYGTHKAKRYTASKAFRQSVRKTYTAQPAKRREQVSRGARNVPGPAAAVVRHEHTSRVAANRRASGTDRPSGVIPGLGQAQQQQRTQKIVSDILAAHRQTPISPAGDTKSNLELVTADAFKASPQFGRDFLAVARSAAANSQRQSHGGIASSVLGPKLAAAVEPVLSKSFKQTLGPVGATFNLTSAIRKGLGTENKPGWKNLPANFIKELADLPAQSVPSTYEGLIKPALKGDVKTVGKNIIDPYVKIAEHPARQLQEHPLSTGLAVYGPLKGVSNLARTGAVKAGAIPAFRPEKVFPNSPLTSGPRPVARGIVGAVAQTIKDKPIRKGDKPPEEMTIPEVKRAAHEDTSATEQVRRIDRELAAMQANDAIGKKPTAGHILAVQNIANNIGEVRGYLRQTEASLAKNQAELNALRKAKAPKRDVVNRRSIIAAQKATTNSIRDFLNRKEIRPLKDNADFPESVRGEIEAYKAVSQQMQGKLGKLYGQSARLEMRSLLPYAIQHMGAKQTKSAWFNRDTRKVAPPAEIRAAREDLGLYKNLKDDERAAAEKKFDEKYGQATNKFVDKEGLVLEPEDIRAHMKSKPGPFDKAGAAGKESFSTYKHQYKPTAEGINQKPWYHGTGKGDLKASDLDSLGSNEANLFGQGIYLTDNPKIAGEYAAARSRRSGTPTVYKSEVQIKNPLDMQAPVNKDFAASLVDRMNNLAGRGDKDAAAELAQLAKREGVTNEQLYKDFREKVADFSRDEEIYSSELVEDFQTLAADLKDKGFDALTHEGGKRVGTEPHQVAILLDPNDVGGGGRVGTTLRSLEKVDHTKEAVGYRNVYHGVTDPAYISHAPNRKSAAAYFVNTNRPQNITPSGFSGRSIEQGLGDLTKNVPVEDLVRAQGLITAAERFKQMISDIAVRRDPRVDVDPTEGVVVESGFPQVLTFKNKASAENKARDLNDKYPAHQVVPVRIALHPQQAKEFLSEANTDEQMGQIAQDAIKDALDGKDIRDGGSWALMPKDYVNETVKYLDTHKPIMRMIGSQFRRTVLGLSIPWMVGNYSEATIRSALNGVGPRSYFTGRQVLKHLQETNPQAWRELQVRAAGGGHYGIQRSAGIYTGYEHLQDASRPVKGLVNSIVALKTNPVTGPPARAVGHVWDAWTDFVFNKVNSRIESQFQTAMLGKSFRDQLMNDSLFKLSKKAMQEAADNKLSLRTMDALGRQVDEMYGKYSKFSPTLKRAVAHETPFIAWYLNAVKFIYKTMPKNHPIATTLINSAYSATEEWRKDKGLGLFLEGHLPYFLQGSVPGKGGNLRFRYTPFSVMTDPLGSAAGIVFPQFKSVILNLMGLDWKGDPLPGYDESPVVGATEAVKSLTAGLLPGYTQVNKALNAREGETTEQHVRRAVGDPFLPSKTPAQRAGKTQSKYSTRKRSGPSGKYSTSKSSKGSGGKYKIK